MAFIFHGLTAILILLKLLGVLKISWLLACSPTLGLFGLTLILLAFAGAGLMIAGFIQYKAGK